MKRKKGQRFSLTGLHPGLEGMLVEFVKQYDRTSDVAVRVVESREHPTIPNTAWKPGDVMCVAPYNLKPTAEE